jgi:hypothetical protein
MSQAVCDPLVRNELIGQNKIQQTTVVYIVMGIVTKFNKLQWSKYWQPHAIEPNTLQK